jgi:hypothetical protein
MAEFWEEEAIEDRQDMRKQAIRWGFVFAFLIAGMVFAVWWSSSAVSFSSSRVDASTNPSYRVKGIVRDAATGAPIPWAEVSDDASARPPLFHSTADRFGGYELRTIAEPHAVVYTALGYLPATVHIGKAWYLWMPSGAENVDVRLNRE